DDEEALAARHGRTRLDQHRDDLAGHRGAHLALSRSRRGRCARAPRVEQLHAVDAAADVHEVGVAAHDDAHVGQGVVDEQREAVPSKRETAAMAAAITGRSPVVSVAPGRKWRAMNPVSMSPARKAGCSSAQRWNAMLATGPTTVYSRSARSIRSIASSLLLPQATSFEIIGS